MRRKALGSLFYNCSTIQRLFTLESLRTNKQTMIS